MRAALFSLYLIFALGRTAIAHDAAAEAHYLANEGVMVAHGETKILFDPLFNENFGQYRLLPDDMRTTLMNGEPPWDGVDAVFISHHHDDHFDPRDVLEYLQKNTGALLFAPEQAVRAMQAVAADDDATFERVTAVLLDSDDPPRQFERPGLLIEVVRIPHSGWPERRLDVENLAWRVTLDGGPTVLHLGDADTRDVHYARAADYWQQRPAHLAFPPYWYFLSGNGLEVLATRLRPAHAVGVHVPTSIAVNPEDREEPLRQVDLFTRPGEIRSIDHRH